MKRLISSLCMLLGAVAGLLIARPALAAESNTIANPSLEIVQGENSPEHWSPGTWGGNTATFTYPVAGFNDEHAAQVTITEYASGDAKWHFEEVAVTPGQVYEFSDAYLATAPSEVVVEFRTGEDNYAYTYLDTLPETNSWQQFSKTFTVPEGATTATVFHLIYSVGTLTTDAFSLSLTDTSPILPAVEPVPSPEPELTPAPEPKPLPISSTGLVSLDFDDGWISHYTTALPRLQNANFKATYYIATRLLGTPGYLSRGNVLDIQAAGFQIGAHSLTHSSLPGLSPAQMQNEVAGSKAELEDLGINSVTTFAYPYGEYSAATDAVVKSAGFGAARSTDFGFNTSSTNRYNLHIQSIEVRTSVDQVKAWIDEATANNSWLILLFHQIDYAGGQYSYTPENFQQVLDYLRQRQVPVVTTSEGLRLVQ